MVSKEEQRRAAKERGRQNYEHRNDGGFAGKRAIDLSRIGGFRNDLFYRPKEGKNRIDILPYVVKTGKHPQKIKQGYTDYLLDVWVHRRVGPSESTYLCLKRMFGQACPICEELDILKKDPNADEDELKSLKAKRRCWYNVINLDLPEREQKVQIFEEAHYLFEKELLEKANIGHDEVVTFWDTEDGRTVEFRAEQKKSKKGQYFEYRIDNLSKRDSYNDSIFNETFSFDDILIIPTYEEVRNAFVGAGEDDSDEYHEESPKNRRESSESTDEPRRSRRQAPADELPEPEPRRSRRAESQTDDEDAGEGRRRGRERARSDNPCPHGYKFGVDNDEFKECAVCDKKVWDACADAHDRK